MKKALRILLCVLFCVYCLALLKFLFLDGRYCSEDTVWFYYRQSSLISFRLVYDYISKLNADRINPDIVIRNIVGNLVVFFPMGCFLPCMFQTCQKFKKVFLICVGIILTVELLQPLFRVGFFDIDDFILNLSGACWGFWFVHIPLVKRLLEKVNLYNQQTY